MTAATILEAVAEAGGQLTVNGDRLKVQAPAPLPAGLQQAIRDYKSELLALLTTPPANEKPPLGQVGRHGAPCTSCGSTWQWPTTDGGWVCSACFCAGRNRP